MSDQKLRDLERRWRQTGSVEDEAAYLLERVRVGDLMQERLELAAYCGHQGASVVAIQAGTAPDLHGFLRAIDTFGRRALAEAACVIAEGLIPCWRAVEPTAEQFDRFIAATRSELQRGPHADRLRLIGLTTKELPAARSGAHDWTAGALRIARIAVELSIPVPPRFPEDPKSMSPSEARKLAEASSLCARPEEVRCWVTERLQRWALEEPANHGGLGGLGR